MGRDVRIDPRPYLQSTPSERELTYYGDIYGGFAQRHFAKPAAVAFRRYLAARIGRRGRGVGLSPKAACTAPLETLEYGLLTNALRSALVCLLLIAALPAQNPPPSEYRIGEGDVLQISVWGEPAASVPSVVVRPDGNISLPLLKDVAVAGLTPAQVEKVVTLRLADIIKSANVTVIVAQVNSKKVYLLGAVKKEGTIPYTYQMTVMQALSEAGGLTDYAKRRKIYVMRNGNGKEQRLPFDYDAVVKGQHMELNVSLLPGDTIVVPH